jgi:hypothetical protein
MADWIHNQNQAPKPTNPSKTQMSEPHKKKKESKEKQINGRRHWRQLHCLVMAGAAWWERGEGKNVGIAMSSLLLQNE